jgi:SpoVK/Ycf46/Vps4 family AAA+-type ATPase
LIWDLHLNKRLKSKEVLGATNLDEKLYVQLAEQTEGYSGAEIEQAVVAGLFDAFSEKRSITPDDLSKSVQNMVPLSITQAEAIDTIREWANVRAVAATAAEDMAEIKHVEKSEAPKPLAPVVPTRGGRTVDF